MQEEFLSKFSPYDSLMAEKLRIIFDFTKIKIEGEIEENVSLFKV